MVHAGAYRRPRGYGLRINKGFCERNGEEVQTVKPYSGRKIINRICLIFAGMMLFMLPCRLASAEYGDEIMVSAAISLKNAFEEIGRAYEAKNKSIKVRFNFGSTGSLMRQIEGGAAVDIFASADMESMAALESKGLIIPRSSVVFAGNSLVLIAPVNFKSGITSFQDLKKDGVRRVAIGNPRTVPAGRYAEEVLEHLRLRGGLKDKIILSENVRQVLDYVSRGEVDAGMVYSTDALIRTKEVRIVAKAPEDSHKPIYYPAAIVKGTSHEAAATGFIAFLVSGETKDILKKYGFKIFAQNKSKNGN